MTIRTVAILSPGDMGHNVGIALRKHGLRVITCLAGRSDRTRKLSEIAGIEDMPSLESLVTEADLILSIMPPAAAIATAELVGAAMKTAGSKPYYADCNAVSTGTTLKTAEIITAAGASFIDAGIVGSPPGRTALATRFYVSGPDAEVMDVLASEHIAVRPLGPEIGRASVLKMCFAATTKGAWTLYTAALVTGEVMGLSDVLLAELKSSRPDVEAEMRRWVPRLPVDAGRWIGEMAEIAATFGRAGLPTGFHQAAGEVFTLLDQTPIARETRETIDPNRTLEEALAMYAAALPNRKFTAPPSGAQTLTAQPLTPEAFAPYGHVFPAGKGGSPGTRDSLVARMENRRNNAQMNACMSYFAPSPMPFTVKALEIHRYSSQTFVPFNMGRYLVLVAPSDKNGEPVTGELLAFHGDVNQGITYNPDVWHHPFTALDEQAECLMLRFDDGSKVDTEWHKVANGPVVTA
ncbi:MAG: ureidoglycolate lyase [Alphaproteobacteria bacterium]